MKKYSSYKSIKALNTSVSNMSKIPLSPTHSSSYRKLGTIDIINQRPSQKRQLYPLSAKNSNYLTYTTTNQNRKKMFSSKNQQSSSNRPLTLNKQDTTNNNVSQIRTKINDLQSRLHQIKKNYEASYNARKISQKSNSKFKDNNQSVNKLNNIKNKQNQIPKQKKTQSKLLLQRYQNNKKLKCNVNSASTINLNTVQNRYDQQIQKQSLSPLSPKSTTIGLLNPISTTMGPLSPKSTLSPLSPKNYILRNEQKSFSNNHINNINSNMNTNNINSNMNTNNINSNMNTKQIIYQQKHNNQRQNYSQQQNNNQQKQNFNQQQNYNQQQNQNIQQQHCMNTRLNLKQSCISTTNVNSNKINVANNQNSPNLKQYVTTFTIDNKLPLSHSTSQSNLYKPMNKLYKNQTVNKNQYYISPILSAFESSSHQQTSFQNLCRQHLISSLDILAYIKNSKKQPPVNYTCKSLPPVKDNKHTIIFDLDQTLIHCNENLNIQHDIALPIKFPNGTILKAGINVRPYAKQCLKELSKYFQLIVFTASHQCYGNVIVDYLDPKKQYISYRYFRDSCYKTQEGFYVKDLRVIDRDLKKVLLIDNAAYSYCFQLQNGIPIIPFYDNKADLQLKNLIPYLKSFINLKQVKIKNQSEFKLNQYGNFKDVKTLINKLYASQSNQ